jgi:hypothetical protein
VAIALQMISLRKPKHMTNLLNLLRPLIGKNIASLLRSLVTLLGGFLVTVGLLTAAQTADGIQVGEVISVIGGALLMLTSRLINWIRARTLFGRSLSPAADFLGPIIGRSLHSLTRAIMTALAGGLIAIEAVPAGATAPQIEALDVVNVLVALVLWAIGRIYSYFQDKPKLA